MRRKKPSRKQADSVISFEHEKSAVKLYSSGVVQIEGDVKHAAFAFAKHILAEYNGYSKQVMNKYLVINCLKGQDYTLDWNTSIDVYEAGISAKVYDKCAKPPQWDEFKEEFERVCKLKIFS